MTPKKLILVIGATGAQGIAVINALLAPSHDGSPSPYSVRALTRNVDGARAKGLASKGVELVQGAFDDFEAVRSAFQGVYGAWVNTDGFTVGEQKEIYAGIRIFEIAKQTPSVRHYIWSNLDYTLKLGGYNEKYNCVHSNGKGRVGEWLQMQPTSTSEDGFTWSQVSTTPYMEMLTIHMFGPINVRADGTYVFTSPIGDGRVPMVALDDIGYFARYSFDHRSEVSGKDLLMTSDFVGWDRLVETFTKVTGKPAVYVRQTFDELVANFDNADLPLASDLIGKPEGAEAITWRQNFSAWWSMWRDGIVKRDLDWVRSVHPGVLDLETWMRKTGYTGEKGRKLLKGAESDQSVRVRMDLASRL